MKTIFGIKGYSLHEYAIAANAELGTRDSGKTYAGCEAAEECYDGAIPSICIDPIGRWNSLRVPAPRKGGKGYPFVVAGGKVGDLPLTRQNVEPLVRAAMKDGVSLVIDLFSRDLSKNDWRYIVQAVCNTLLYENEEHGLRHLFIEEAGEFVPQRVQDGHVFAAVEKVVRMGGNSKVGCTLIHQRPEDINKSVLELCANVMLLRQTGKNTLTGLKKWFDKVTPDIAAKIADTLPNLKPGHGWLIGKDIPAPIAFKVPPRRSKHPDRRDNAVPADQARGQLVSAEKFVEQMRAALAPKATPAKPAAHTVNSHRTTPAPAAAPSAREIAAAREEGRREGFGQGWEASAPVHYQAGAAAVRKAFGNTQIGVCQPQPVPKRLPPAQTGPASPASPAPATARAAPAYPRAAPAPRSTASRQAAFPDGITKGEGVILAALAAHPNGCTRPQLTILTGYKRTTRDQYLKQTAQKGWSVAAGDRIEATAVGIDALGDSYEQLPTGSALREHWLGKLPAGDRRVLRIRHRRLSGQRRPRDHFGGNGIQAHDARPVHQAAGGARTRYGEPRRRAGIRYLVRRRVVMANKKSFKIARGRYEMRNGLKVRVTAVDGVKTSDGETILQAWGEELISGQMRMWNATTGRRVPPNMPGARKQDLVKRLGR